MVDRLTPINNTTAPKRRNRTLLLDSAVTASAALVGAGIGYKKYSSDKLELQNSIKKVKNEADKPEVETLKTTITQAESKLATATDELKTIVDKKLDPSNDLSSQKVTAERLDKFIDEYEPIHSLSKKFTQLIDLEINGQKTKMPNCVMLVGQDENLINEAIDWTKRNSACNFVKVANSDRVLLQDELWDQLNVAKEIFLKTKKRTLIHVKDFDSLINPSMNTFENIDGLKDVMQRCANDFGTTIIFGSKDTSKLNNEAIQPHRINAWIEVDDKANQKAFDLCKKLEQRKKAIEDSIDSKKIEIKTKQKEVQNLTEELNGFKSELEKLNPVKILTDKLENLPKGKIFQLAAIGAAVGIALVGIKHLISNKNKQN